MAMSLLGVHLHASLICLYLLVLSMEGYASQHTHTIEVSSLFSSDSCKPSTQGLEKGRTSLKVVHMHGPCSHLTQDKNYKAPTAAEILLQDQYRVKSIHARLSKLSKPGTTTGSGDGVAQAESTTLPTNHGSKVGTGNYIVGVGLGTPKKDFSLVFDTGSDLTWTQCEPCVAYCYQQKEDKYNPLSSSTYHNVSCAASLCTSLKSATGNNPGCSSSTCVYGVKYADQSYTIGFFGKEKLTLTSTDVFDDFYFGCGQNNHGFSGAAGLLGLGRDKLSLVSQTARKYNKLFSYCLPSTPSSTGYLTFGSYPSNPIKFTPIYTLSWDENLYGIEFIGISVRGKKLSISDSVFSTAGAVIDSGTVITRLPPDAYTELRTAFRQAMARYPTAPALLILDTCYDFSKYETILVPKIRLLFYGGVEVEIDVTGIFYVRGISQVCLAFAPNSDDSDVAIFGNTQQRTLEIVYDVGGGNIGFASGGCN